MMDTIRLTIALYVTQLACLYLIGWPLMQKLRIDGKIAPAILSIGAGIAGFGLGNKFDATLAAASAQIAKTSGWMAVKQFVLYHLPSFLIDAIATSLALAGTAAVVCIVMGGAKNTVVAVARRRR